MRAVATDVCSVVCVLITSVSPAKMAEPIPLPFKGRLVDIRNDVLHRSIIIKQSKTATWAVVSITVATYDVLVYCKNLYRSRALYFASYTKP